MSHEKGIEAACNSVSANPDDDLDLAIEKAIKAYLDASGMVMVPREPTDEMLEVSFYWYDYAKADETYPNSRGTWRAMLSTSPDPFQTPEESREKK